MYVCRYLDISCPCACARVSNFVFVLLILCVLSVQVSIFCRSLSFVSLVSFLHPYIHRNLPCSLSYIKFFCRSAFFVSISHVGSHLQMREGERWRVERSMVCVLGWIRLIVKCIPRIPTCFNSIRPCVVQSRSRRHVSLIPVFMLVPSFAPFCMFCICLCVLLKVYCLHH